MSYLTLIDDDGDDDLEIQPLCKENSNSNQIKSNQIKANQIKSNQSLVSIYHAGPKREF